MAKTIDDKMLDYLRKENAIGYRSCDEWQIAAALFPFGDISQRSKKGAWIRCVVQAGIRLKDKGLADCFMIQHGMPGYNAPQSRMWFAKSLK